MTQANLSKSIDKEEKISKEVCALRGTDKSPLGQKPTRTKAHWTISHWTKAHCLIWQGGTKAHFFGKNRFKAALSVTFDLLILELKFLLFKNTLKKLKFRHTFYQFRKS